MAPRRVKMGDVKGHRPTRVQGDIVLPSCDSDPCPKFTKFINDMGSLYNQTYSWHQRGPKQVSPSAKKRVFDGIAHYFSEEFIKVLKRELQIPD